VADVDDAPGGDIVDQHRQLHRVVASGEVAIEPFLIRLVVIGRDHQRGVGAYGLRVMHEIDRFGGRIRAGPRDHRHAAGRGSDAKLNHLAVFVVTHGRALARGAHRHQAVDAADDLALD